eukprot:CAMPEP_0183743758 /NCGR_PEP_ID=MMETSP0737-20130205/65381_1 /TAXON_ID=385413 /ORGANISM="Thalassiosira miniscula, Strain CCMP1093" /LENGTH=478 /DNA_ID=CAMNT_0025979387 /DNA_START=508 /DNA_END=1945 /DNA_ORIENTATION=+
MSLLSNLLAVPAYLFFQLTWLLHSLRRPLLLVSALCLLSNPKAAYNKLKLFYVTFIYLLFSKDKTWKVPKDKDPASFFPKELGGTLESSNTSKKYTYREKTVILIRHGESTWNDTFNAGDRSKPLFILFFIPNLIYATILEIYYIISGKDDHSWFFDSALSQKGVGQADGLRKFLKKEKMRLGSKGTPDEERAVKLLLAVGEESNPSSTVVSSNLRRAISTAAIGLADRFIATAVKNESSNKKKKKDDILLLPCLQEISRNPDALTILPPRGVAHPTWCDEDISGFIPQTSFGGMIDTKYQLIATAVKNESSNKKKKKDDILLLPCLQEISRNPDALTILPPRGVAHPTWCDEDISGFIPQTSFGGMIDTKYHTGNKSVNSTGLIRLEQFCHDIFDNAKLPKDVIIATGHSLFFRSVFQVYLPRGYEHISKKKKLVNGGTVMVTLREATETGSGKKEYMIDERSVVMVYGGFGKHTKG